MFTHNDVFDVISCYTDEDALLDGCIHDITPMGLLIYNRPVSRITNTLYCACSAGENITDEEHAALTRAMIEEGIRGIIPPNPEEDPDVNNPYMVVSHTVIPARGSVEKIYFVQNEVGGFTVMFPEDY